MIPYNDLIQSYCKALKANDYQGMMRLFSKDAKVFSYIAGEQSAPEFYQYLFKTTRRTKVELKNIFIGLENKTTVAAYLSLEGAQNGNVAIQNTAADIFEFNSENKIIALRLIIDKLPLKKTPTDDNMANAMIPSNC